MQFSVPSSHVVIGVFQNLMLLKYDSGALAWKLAQEPGLRDSISAQAPLLTGVSPKLMACAACTLAVLTDPAHLLAPLGRGALLPAIPLHAPAVASSPGHLEER